MIPRSNAHLWYVYPNIILQQTATTTTQADSIAPDATQAYFDYLLLGIF